MIVAAALLAFATIAQAQTVRGSVVDRVDSAPVPGVVVLLIDDGGNVAARALTNERGEFRLPAGTPGVYRLRTMRIGFRPVTSDVIQVAAGEEVTRQVVVAGVPFSLDTVRVQRRSTCRMRADSALVTYAIWEQVRTALTATDLSSRARNVFATIVTYERFLEPRSKRVLRQSSRVKSGETNRPWTSLSADSLRRVGYVAEVNGWSIYTAPDLDALLSAQFLEDHCFRIAQLSDSGWVGLAFEPAPDRKHIPEISGTVWLDRRSAELRRMEFLYTHISPDAEDGNAGGDMDFIRAKHGAWAISAWNIRMPVLTQNFFRSEPGNPAQQSREKIIVKEIKVGGGELALMMRGRDTLWSRPPLTLTGTVTDSVSGRAAVAARVVVKGTSLQGTTDSSGRFAIDGALPGEYTILVRTPSLDSLAAVWQSWVAFSDTRPVALRVPSAANLQDQWCPDSVTGSGTSVGLVTGEVRVRGDSIQRQGIGVIVEWLSYFVMPNDMAVALTRSKGLTARTDDAGVYRICGVPVNTAFKVRTALDDKLSTPGRIPPDERFARVDVIVDTQTSVAGPRPRP